MKEYIRWHKQTILQALKTRRVIIISGARQVGKTTLTKQALPTNAIFRTLDDSTLLTAAMDDPAGFVNHKEDTLVIDEIQKVPSLLPEIKKVVDVDNRPGQFVLTGSANIQSIPTVNESLAGRVKNVRLRTLAQGEILGNPPVFLKQAFNNKFKSQYPTCTKQAVLEIALRGGYPEPLRLSVNERKEWHRDYLQALLMRDLKDIANIKRQDALRQLMEALAAWSSKYIDLNGIGSSIGITKPTLISYINLIKDIYLCDTLPAWIKTDYDRINKKDKFYFTDTGLMSSILNWHIDNVALDADKYGKLIETLVFNELKAQVDMEPDYALYHFRDRSGHEIDFLLEDGQGNIVGIEVKGGSQVNREDFRHLDWFKTKLATNKRFIGLVLYAGKDTVSFGPDFQAVPLASLWEK